MKKTNQKGFTLIELIMVIVILGILSAFALPRFADFGSNAERASLDGARASVQSASGIVRSAALVNGVASDATETVSVDGEPSLDVIFGFATASSILTAANISSADYFTDTSGADPVVLSILIDGNENTAGADCFTYTEAADADTPAEISAIGSWDEGNNTCS